MADDQVVIDVLIAYSTDPQKAQEAARVWSMYQNAEERKAMSASEKLQAKSIETNLANARRFFKDVAEGRIKSEKHTAEEAAKIYNDSFTGQIEASKKAIAQRSKDAITAAKTASAEISQIEVAEQAKTLSIEERQEKASLERRAQARRDLRERNKEAAKERVASSLGIEEINRASIASMSGGSGFNIDAGQGNTAFRDALGRAINQQEVLAKEESKRQAKLKIQQDAERVRLAESEYAGEGAFGSVNQGFKSEASRMSASRDEISSRIDAEKNLRQAFVETENEKKKLLEERKRGEKEYFDYVAELGKEAKKRDAKKEAEITQIKKDELVKREKEEERAQAHEIARQRKKIQYLNKVAQVARAVSVVSIGLLTGVTAAATKWANKMEQEGTRTDISRRWINAMKNMEKSSMRIGAVLAEKLVPHLEKAAEILEKVAKFVEDNPGLVEGGIKVAAVAAIISTVVGTLLKVTTMLESISVSQASAGLSKLGSGAGSAISSAGGAIAGSLGFSSVGALVAAVIPYLIVTAVITAIFAAVYKLLSNAGLVPDASKVATVGADFAAKGISKVAVGLGMDEGEAKKKADGFVKLVAYLTGAIDKETPFIEKLTKVIKALGGQADETSAAVAKTEAELEQMKETTKRFNEIFSNLDKENLKAETEYKKNVETIVKGANARLLEIERQGRAALASLAIQNKKAEKKEKESLAKDLASLDSNYNDQRSKIMQSSAEEIIRINQQTQEQLRKLEEEHNLRVEELVRARDALGLAKENRDYGRSKDEISAEGKKMAAERKKEAARALEDLRKSYNEQRAERIRAYNEQVAERKKAVAEQMAEIYARIAQEKEATILQKNEMLASLKVQFDEEKRQRYESAREALRQLDLSMVNEVSLKRRYYGLMLNDANGFAASLRNTIAAAYQSSIKSGTGTSSGGTSTGSSSGTGIVATISKGATAIGASVSNYWTDFIAKYNAKVQGNYAAGGYVEKEGIYRVGEGNLKEFVMNNQTTSAAEKIVGGQLTQAKMLSAMTQNNSNKSSVVWNDQRSFSGNVPKNVRDEIRDETLADVTKMLKMIGGRA